MIISLAVLIQGVNSTALAKVSSISGASLVTIDGQEYQSVAVKCRSGRVRSTLLNNKITKQWCDSTVASACYSDKIRAAQYVCSSSYSRAVKELSVSSSVESDNEVVVAVEPAPAPVVNNDALNAEKQKIDDAILAIKAKRLVLRQRETDLLEKLGGA